jgi:hypothetical protein
MMLLFVGGCALNQDPNNRTSGSPDGGPATERLAPATPSGRAEEATVDFGGSSERPGTHEPSPGAPARLHRGETVAGRFTILTTDCCELPLPSRISR